MANKILPLLRKGVRLANIHSPAILTAAGIGGFATTLPLVLKGKKKADRLFIEKEAEKKELGENPVLTKKEKAAIYAKSYWPAATSFTVSAGCVIFAHHTQSKRLAVLEAGLVTAQGELVTLKEQLTEALGEKEAKAIIDKAEQSETEKRIKEYDGTIEKTGMGNQLCMDLWSGRLFYSDIESIRRAFNDLNAQRLANPVDMTPYNDLFYYLGLESSESGGMFGWDSPTFYMDPKGKTKQDIVPDFVSGITDDGQTYLAFRPSMTPEPL